MLGRSLAEVGSGEKSESNSSPKVDALKYRRGSLTGSTIAKGRNISRTGCNQSSSGSLEIGVKSMVVKTGLHR